MGNPVGMENAMAIKRNARYTSITVTDPAIAAQWDWDNNKTITPEDVTRGSEEKVWWTCEEGHHYEAAVFSRVAGTGCPYCAGRKVLAGFNDLATTDPTVARDWYAPLNGEVTPQTVNRGCHKKVWWTCREGHVWQAAVYSRTRAVPARCPVCTGKVREDDYFPLSAK